MLINSASEGYNDRRYKQTIRKESSVLLKLLSYSNIQLIKMIFLLLGIVSIGVYLYIWYRFSFWERNGVKYAKTRSILGNISDNLLQKRSMADIQLDLYNRFPDEPFFGIYAFFTPILVIRDPELAKELTVKNSDIFFMHKLFSTGEAAQVFSNNLFVANKQRWKNIRPCLTPAFTGSKMKGLFGLVNKCSKQCIESFSDTTENVTVVDAKRDIFLRFTVDVIATCIFGLESNSCLDKNNEFFIRGAEVGDFGGNKIFASFGYCYYKYIVKLFNLRIIPAEDEAFFSKLVLDTIKMRKERSIVRPDMLNLLMEAQQGIFHQEAESSVDDAGFATVRETNLGAKTSTMKISDLDVAGHGLLLLIAGSDTTSLPLTLMAYELATHKDIQDRLYQELRNAVEELNGHMTYEKLMSLKYLDMVCSETLRKWPPLPVTDRVTTRPFTLNFKGRTIHLEKGSSVWFPTICFHRDPKYYPDPEKFDPERFSDENKAKFNKDNYIPFGYGPRACLGSRLALLMLKSIIMHVVCEFEMLAVEKTPNPLVLSKKHFFLNSDTPIYVGLKRRSK